MQTQLLLPLLLSLFLCACGSAQTADEGKEKGQAVEQFFAMDTVMEITAYGDGAVSALEESKREIARLEQIFSAEKEGAELYQLNESGEAACTDDLLAVIEAGQKLYAETDGAFNIALYPVKQAWGFTDKNYRVPDEAELKELLAKTDPTAAEVLELPAQDWPNLPAEEGVSLHFGVRYVNDGMALDLGGIAKGYTADKVAARLHQNGGVDGALINLGGNVTLYGEKENGEPWRVGIKDPRGIEDYRAVVSIGREKLSDELPKMSVVTSGGYERYFEKDGKRYHHILDPKTGQPAATGIVSATIVAKDGTVADALSTAVYVMGLQAAADFWRRAPYDFSMILMDEAGSIHVTEDIASDVSSDGQIEVISYT